MLPFSAESVQLCYFLQRPRLYLMFQREMPSRQVKCRRSSLTWFTNAIPSRTETSWSFIPRHVSSLSRKLYFEFHPASPSQFRAKLTCLSRQYVRLLHLHCPPPCRLISHFFKHHPLVTLFLRELFQEECSTFMITFVPGPFRKTRIAPTLVLAPLGLFRINVHASYIS